mmetsp:Transcript_796/g.1992  ORF Transcript_796/g.1992 Transcript_796/m.1992 type:complete len:230 (-) Transcript_796:183-872(-)
MRGAAACDPSGAPVRAALPVPHPGALRGLRRRLSRWRGLSRWPLSGRPGSAAVGRAGRRRARGRQERACAGSHLARQPGRRAARRHAPPRRDAPAAVGARPRAGAARRAGHRQRGGSSLVQHGSRAAATRDRRCLGRAMEWLPRPTHASCPAPPGRRRRTPRDGAPAAAVRRPVARAWWRRGPGPRCLSGAGRGARAAAHVAPLRRRRALRRPRRRGALAPRRMIADRV